MQSGPETQAINLSYRSHRFVCNSKTDSSWNKHLQFEHQRNTRELIEGSQNCCCCFCASVALLVKPWSWPGLPLLGLQTVNIMLKNSQGSVPLQDLLLPPLLMPRTECLTLSGSSQSQEGWVLKWYSIESFMFKISSSLWHVSKDTDSYCMLFKLVHI